MAARRTRRTRAIVVAHRARLSERDVILTLLAREGDRLDAIAKGGLRPGGGLAARIELFSETDFLIARGRNLGIVTEAQVKNAHPAIRGDIARVSAASALCEVARLTSYEDTADPFVFALLSRALTAVEQAPDEPRLNLVVAAYALKATSHGGWRPELASCISCGDKDVSFFSPSAGGALCESCARNVPGAIASAPAAIQALELLIRSTFDDILRMEPGAASSRELLSLAHVWAATHLEARLRAFEFMRGL